jgi:hypothetical protein
MRALFVCLLCACSRAPAQCEELVRVADAVPSIETHPDALALSAQDAEKLAGRVEALVIREAPQVKQAALDLAGELRTLADGLRLRVPIPARTKALAARAGTLGSQSDAARLAIDGAKGRIQTACKTRTPECKEVEQLLATLPKDDGLDAFADKLAKLDAKALTDDVRAIEKALREDAATLREIDKLSRELADHKKDADSMAWLDRAREPAEKAAARAREACR